MAAGLAAIRTVAKFFAHAGAKPVRQSRTGHSLRAAPFRALSPSEIPSEPSSIYPHIRLPNETPRASGKLSQPAADTGCNSDFGEPQSVNAQGPTCLDTGRWDFERLRTDPLSYGMLEGPAEPIANRLIKMALPRGRGVSPRNYRKIRPSQQVVTRQCMTACMPSRHAIF